MVCHGMVFHLSTLRESVQDSYERERERERAK